MGPQKRAERGRKHHADRSLTRNDRRFRCRRIRELVELRSVLTQRAAKRSQPGLEVGAAHQYAERPSRIWTTRSHIAAASALWVAMRIAWPPAASERSSARTVAPVRESRFP